MTLPRRAFLHLSAGAMALPAASRLAWAQATLSRPVRIIVGFAPGSAADIVSRLLAKSLSERLGQSFIVDNRPGVGGNIATEAVVQAEPDGYTLLMAGPSSAINATLYEKLGFHVLSDIAPVAATVRTANVMLASPSLPATTVPELIALAKTHPGTIRMASAGVGTSSHLAGELFRTMTGASLVHVPYRGGGTQAYSGLLGGEVEVYFPSLASSMGYIRARQLAALAVTSASRSEQLPDIRAMGEFVPGYEASTWLGVGAPKSTPAGIVARLNTAINESLADPTVSERLADLGGTALTGSPADFGKLIAAETEKWAKVVRFSGVA